MDQNEIEKAASFLSQSRLGGPRTSLLPEELVPQTETEGYAIQAALHEILALAGYGNLVGHKIGCTTEVMQKFLNIDHPCAGEIFRSMVFLGEANIQLSRFHRIGVECEIAARLGQDMLGEKGPYTRESAAAAVGSLMGAIELVDERYENYAQLNAPTLIADDFFNAGVVLGAEEIKWQELNLGAIDGVLYINNCEHSRGVGSDILGHPLEALAWLANHRAGLGRPLRAGTFVMLGSVVETVFFDSPAEVSGLLEGLGEARVKFI